MPKTDSRMVVCADHLVARDERLLVGLALALDAPRVAGWSPGEARTAGRAAAVAPNLVADVKEQIRSGEDPLGEFFCQIRSAEQRRSRGATLTPVGIVEAMLLGVSGQMQPERVVDPGVGSGRFLIQSAKRFPHAKLHGIEIDPLPAMLARANLATLGLSSRSQVTLADYPHYPLSPVEGPSLFIGNPPYVRHHQLMPQAKAWLTEQSARCGLKASQLAGLHVHFYLATALKAKPGDSGCFITSAEWLDVNYGQLVRDLFLGRLGGDRIIIIEPTAMPFPDAATTAAITHFHIGSRPSQIHLRRVPQLSDLSKDGAIHEIRRERLETERRWSHLTRPPRRIPGGFVELGELCRVHRGQVTGANRLWIEGEHSRELPASVLYPTVTRAREIFNAGRTLDDPSRLRRVIDLPENLDVFPPKERRVVDLFLANARRAGAHNGYIASHRRAWWSVGLRTPARILATYMARRPPAFVENAAEARHLNIAHGLYPRDPLSDKIVESLVRFLSRSVRMDHGRTYAGGLTKFEPREMERLIVPGPELLKQGVS